MCIYENGQESVEKRTSNTHTIITTKIDEIERDAIEHHNKTNELN